MVDFTFFKEVRDEDRVEESINIKRVTAFDNRLFGLPSKKQIVKQYKGALDLKEDSMV